MQSFKRDEFSQQVGQIKFEFQRKCTLREMLREIKQQVTDLYERNIFSENFEDSI